jgi:hypothetical protein
MNETPRPPYTRFCTFLHAPTKWWQLPRALFQPSPMHYLIHLERLDQLQIEMFRYIWAIEDFEATIEYKSYRMQLWMAWEGDLVLLGTDDVPSEIFQHVCGHLHRYKHVPVSRLNEYKKRYKRPAKVTWYEK